MYLAGFSPDNSKMRAFRCASGFIPNEIHEWNFNDTTGAATYVGKLNLDTSNGSTLIYAQGAMGNAEDHLVFYSPRHLVNNVGTAQRLYKINFNSGSVVGGTYETITDTNLPNAVQYEASQGTIYTPNGDRLSTKHSNQNSAYATQWDTQTPAPKHTPVSYTH